MINEPVVVVQNDVPPRAGRREWSGLAVIALPCMLYSMDLTVLNLAVPHITEDLQPSSSELLWIVDIYGFLVSGFLITMGTLGDRIGRRKLLMRGALFFAVASAVAAFSHTTEMLIASRAVLGIAGATLAPSTLSLIRNMFHDPKQRTVAIGVWITSYSVGAAIGPLVGGALLEHFWWGSVFLLAIPIMVLLLILGPFLLPEFRDPAAGRIDLFSAALSLAAVLSIIFGLKKMAEQGFQWGFLAIIAAGFIIGYFFLQRQRRLPNPLLDLKLFRIPAFNASLATYLLATFVAFGMFMYTPQYLQLVLGFSPLNAGLWILPSSFGFIIGAMVTTMLVRKIKPATLMAGGSILGAIGYGLFTMTTATSGLGLLVAGSLLSALCISPLFTLTNDMIVSAAPPERAGAAAAISETSSEFGGALGIALLGSIGTILYRSGVANAIPPGIPDRAATAARETLGGAVVEAAQLPSGIGQELLLVARSAFVQGFHATAITNMAILVVLAILCRGVLNRTFNKTEQHA